MSRLVRLSALAAVALSLLVLAACGGPDATPTRDGVRPAPGGTVSGAEGTAQPDALSTPTRTPNAQPSPTPTPIKRDVGTAHAEILDAGEGAYEVVVYLSVPKLGLSGVDVSATALSDDITIEVIAPGTGLGSEPLIAEETVTEDGLTASVAYARRGASTPADADGEVAVLRVLAVDAAAVRDGLVISVEFTDAGLTLHGAVEAPLN